ncbi:hypothetical protein [Companilactobacillus zhongbaensis]|uniref:hypothetical protein n=1 Tax=Companilactobacillus zhongbaensis TaxID=2486009 RepID=UPI000F76E986|nr:hypothetical protein [Companilactobacillus zhongbaensis]
MTSTIENIKIARDIIERDLLKSSDDYETGVQACDEAIAELQPETCEYCDPKNLRAFVIDFNESVCADTDLHTSLYIEDKNLVIEQIDDEFIEHTHIAFPINYCPMCGRKLEVEE